MASRTIPTNGNAIRRRRILAGLTTRGLAKEAEISQGYLVNIEAGNRFGSPPVLKRIADALDCTIADIVNDDALSAA